MITIVLAYLFAASAIIIVVLCHFLIKERRASVAASEALRDSILACRDVDRWCAEFPQSADTARFINHRIREITQDRRVYVRRIDFPSYWESDVAADSKRWAPCGVFEVRALRDGMRNEKEAP